MKNIVFISLLGFILIGCHAAEITRFDSNYYSPTNNIQIYSDLTRSHLKNLFVRGS